MSLLPLLHFKCSSCGHLLAQGCGYSYAVFHAVHTSNASLQFTSTAFFTGALLSCIAKLQTTAVNDIITLNTNTCHLELPFIFFYPIPFFLWLSFFCSCPFLSLHHLFDFSCHFNRSKPWQICAKDVLSPLPSLWNTIWGNQTFTSQDSLQVI